MKVWTLFAIILCLIYMTVTQINDLIYGNFWLDILGVLISSFMAKRSSFFLPKLSVWLSEKINLGI